jgi:hypothetical protein
MTTYLRLKSKYQKAVESHQKFLETEAKYITEDIISQMEKKVEKGKDSFMYKFSKNEKFERPPRKLLSLVSTNLSKEGFYVGPADDHYDVKEIWNGCGGQDVIDRCKYKHTDIPVFLETPGIFTRINMWWNRTSGKDPLDYEWYH